MALTLSQKKTNASRAILGGVQTTPITEDSPEVAAVWAFVQNLYDGAGHKAFLTMKNGDVVVVIKGYPIQGTPLGSRWVKATKTWTGIQSQS